MEAYKKMMWGGTVAIFFLLLLLTVYFFFIKPGAGDSPPLESADNTVRIDGAADDVGAVHKQPDLSSQVVSEPPAFSLQDSDGPVREMTADVSDHPQYALWLKNNHLIRKLTAVVDNIAGGVSPRAHLTFMSPAGKFEAAKKGALLVVDERSFIRYQSVVMVLVSMETEKLTAYYKKLLPLLNEAYSELGYPDKTFSQALAEAFDVILETPLPAGDLELVEKVTTYGFADPMLEGLNDAQKHLLRMGPQNARKIKQMIRDFSAALKAEELL